MKLDPIMQFVVDVAKDVWEKNQPGFMVILIGVFAVILLVIIDEKPR